MKFACLYGPSRLRKNHIDYVLLQVYIDIAIVARTRYNSQLNISSYLIDGKYVKSNVSLPYFFKNIDYLPLGELELGETF